jgi:hypothetical protein
MLSRPRARENRSIDFALLNLYPLSPSLGTTQHPFYPPHGRIGALLHFKLIRFGLAPTPPCGRPTSLAPTLFFLTRLRLRQTRYAQTIK